MPDSWNDKRIDDFRSEVGHRFDAADRRFDAVDQRFDGVDQRFDRVEADLHAFRVETRTEFTAIRGEMKAGFERVDDRFDQINERFEAMHRLMLQLGGGLMVAMIGLIATQL